MVLRSTEVWKATVTSPRLSPDLNPCCVEYHVLTAKHMGDKKDLSQVPLVFPMPFPLEILKKEKKSTKSIWGKFHSTRATSVPQERSASNSNTTIRNAIEGNPALDKDWKRCFLSFFLTLRFCNSKWKFQFLANYFPCWMEACLRIQACKRLSSLETTRLFKAHPGFSPTSLVLPGKKVPAREPALEDRQQRQTG